MCLADNGSQEKKVYIGAKKRELSGRGRGGGLM